MSANILDGKLVSEKILQELQTSVPLFERRPCLAVIMVGEHPASMAYVRQKRKACEKIGIDYQEINLPKTISEDDLIQEVHRLNEDKAITGFIVQFPLPDHLQEAAPRIIKAINPYKDVDGFHAYNLGKMFVSKDFEMLPPATPLGIIKLLEAYSIDVEGMEVVVVGHSNIVGKPISTMLLNRNATVTTCHIHTQDLAAHTRRADLLIVAVGKPNLITADMVKDEAIVVDVGINRVEAPDTPKGYKLVGDVDFDALKEKTAFITPVPGGCGPMTVAALMINTIHAAERQKQGVTQSPF